MLELFDDRVLGRFTDDCLNTSKLGVQRDKKAEPEREDDTMLSPSTAERVRAASAIKCLNTLDLWLSSLRSLPGEMDETDALRSRRYNEDAVSLAPSTTESIVVEGE